MEAQFGSVIYGDLKENTLTIQMEEAITLRAGDYAVIKIDNINDKLKLEDFLKQTE